MLARLHVVCAALCVAIPLAFAAEPSVVVTRVDVVGATALSAERIDAVTRPHLGRAHTFADLHALAGELQKAYEDRGYFLSHVIVPEQELQGGVVRIQVVEDRLSKVRVEGAKHHSDAFVRRHFDHAVGRPAHTRSLERAVRILNQFPELDARAVIARGEDPAAPELVVTVKDASPRAFILGYDNYGNRLTGQNRASGTYVDGNVLTDGDGLSLNVAVPFPSDSDPFFSASYTRPVDARGARMGLEFSNVSTTLGRELRVLDIRGDADVVSLTYSKPLVMAPGVQNGISFALTAKSVKNVVFGATRLNQDEIRLASASFGGSHEHGRGTSSYVLTLSQGLGELLGGSSFSDPVSRPGAASSFTKINLDYSRVVPAWDKGTAVFRAETQLCADPLLVPEQYAVGGPFNVRGYTQSSFLGDSGFLLSGEYRRKIHEKGRDRVDVLAFLDHGQVFLAEARVGERSNRALTGAGIGARATLGRGLTVRTDLGFPIEPGQSVEGKDAVLHAQVQNRF